MAHRLNLRPPASRPLSPLWLLAGLITRRAGLLFALLAIVFIAVEILPGDAASSTVDRGASAAAVAARRAELGLDQPVAVRFLRWMLALPTGDLGVSARGEQVSGIVVRHFPNTLLLAGLAMVVTILMAITLGGIAAIRPGSRLDRLISTSATMVIALPEFVVAGLLVLVFALWFRLLPAVTVTSFDGGIAPEMLVMPVLALAVPQIGWNSRIVRGALLDEARAPHVESAIIDGLPTHQVMLRHVLPGALPTIAAGAATSVGVLLGGAVVVETIFNYPGIGSILAGAVGDRDAPLVAAVVAAAGTAIAVVLLASDLARAWAIGGRA
ncbi:MAG: ABC transporter permease [Actinomycetota bacterium]|nr:ABC transporter permease [Actinomycetota bacterium]